MRPAVALFDFDGTLIDREPLIERAVLEVIGAAGLAAPEGAVTIGRAWQDVHADLGVAELGWDVGTLVDRVRQRASELVAAGFEPPVLPGAVELVRSLAASGMAVAIVSGSTRAELDEGIALLGLGDVVAFHLGAEDYGPGKPHPECYLRAAERLRVEPVRCIVFEDSAVGVAAGLGAGMGVIASSAANPSPGHPAHQRLDDAHAVVTSLAEVTDELMAAVAATVAGIR